MELENSFIVIRTDETSCRKKHRIHSLAAIFQIKDKILLATDILSGALSKIRDPTQSRSGGYRRKQSRQIVVPTTNFVLLDNKKKLNPSRKQVFL